jgi:hypothetical protein
MRETNHIGKLIPEHKPSYIFYASNPEKYKEHPINILFNKADLVRLSSATFIVSKEEIKKINKEEHLNEKII